MKVGIWAARPRSISSPFLFPDSVCISYPSMLSMAVPGTTAGVPYSVGEAVFIDISHKKINSIFHKHPKQAGG